MDPIIQAASVLAAFAMVHERVIEMLRSLNERTLQSEWVDIATKHSGNALIAIVLALATGADLLALFENDAKSHSALFFTYYMRPSTWLLRSAGDNVRAVLGCVLMGLSTALGSQFWHDLAKGLIDARDRARALTNLADAQTGAGNSLAIPPPTPPTAFVSMIGTRAGEPLIPPLQNPPSAMVG